MLMVALVHSRLDYENYCVLVVSGRPPGLPDADTPVSPECAVSTNPPSESQLYNVLLGGTPRYIGPLVHVVVNDLPGRRHSVLWYYQPNCQLLATKPLKSLLLTPGMDC